MGRQSSGGSAREYSLLHVELASPAEQRRRRRESGAGQGGPGYAINVDDSDVDLGRFLAAKTAAVHAVAAGNFDDASRHLSDALAEWRGPVLDDLRDFAFIAAFVTAMTDEKVRAHSARAEAEIACGRGEQVIGELEELAGGQPFRELLWAQPNAAYYLAGRQSDSLDAFQRLKSTLAYELGIVPSPDRPAHRWVQTDWRESAPAAVGSRTTVASR